MTGADIVHRRKQSITEATETYNLALALTEAYSQNQEQEQKRTEATAERKESKVEQTALASGFGE